MAAKLLKSIKERVPPFAPSAKPFASRSTPCELASTRALFDGFPIERDVVSCTDSDRPLEAQVLG
uniref:Uncharacterized protein n=1 Tax=Oryza punctata TaxID=4537 RepID=A0A0E0KQ60_ORYPU